MASIPEALVARFECLRGLDSAYDLLEGVRHDESATAERAFLESKIDSIERELADGEAEAVAIIAHLQDDPITWVAAQLRFLHGYTWAEVAATTGQNEEAIKARCYRAFQRNAQLSVEN